MVPPLLKLEFTAGPRAGDSLRFKPGSTVRVGRIVRGNEIAIKDAGISSKHLRIVSDSENWIIHDLGSSNGTTLNSEAIDPETPVDLSHGDVIKLGEYTSIVVNFVNDVQAPPQEDKLPPKTRRTNKRDADLDPIELDQEKPKRRGRPSKQEVIELPVRTRASRKRNLEDIDEELEIPIAKKGNSRVGRSQKNAIIKEEEVPKAPEYNSRVRKGKNNESVEKLSSKVKVEVEASPKEVKISEVKSRKRATRSKQSVNVKSEDTVVEERVEKRTSRATRSTRTEIGGDSFMELEMVLKKSRAKRKKVEQLVSKSVVEMEDRNDDTGEEALKNCHVGEDEVQGGCSERSEDKCDQVDGAKRVEQVEIELRTTSSIGEDQLNCSVREDGETENLQENENGDCSERIEDRCDKEDEREGDGSKRVEQVETELRTESSIREDGETENIQDVEEENKNEVQGDCTERIEDRCDKEDKREGDGSKRVEIDVRKKKSSIGEHDLKCSIREDGCSTRSDNECDEETTEQGSSSKNIEVDLEKMTFGDWFDYIEADLPKEIIEETEEMIEAMRSKALRVHKYIEEQKAKGV